MQALRFHRAGLPLLGLAAMFILTSGLLRPAQAQIGGAAVVFLQIEPDSRAAGMGNAGVATADNAYSIFWNPAGLAYQQGTELSLTHSNWLPEFNAGLFYEYLVAKHHVPGWGTFGAHLTYLFLGEHEGRDAINQPTGTFRSYDLALGASYGFHLTERFAVGTGLRLIYSNLAPGQRVGAQDTKAGVSAGFDLAGLYKTDKFALGGMDAQLALGFNLANMGPKIQYSDSKQSDPIPTNIRLGYAFTMEFDEYNKLSLVNDFTKMLIHVEVDTVENISRADPFYQALFTAWQPIEVQTNPLSDDQVRTETLSVFDQFTIGAGLEYWYRDLFALRAGYFYENPYNGNRQFLTFGSGLRYNIIGVDFSYIYALEENHPLANTMRFSLLLNFKQDPRARPASGGGARLPPPDAVAPRPLPTRRTVRMTGFDGGTRAKWTRRVRNLLLLGAILLAYPLAPPETAAQPAARPARLAPGTAAFRAAAGPAQAPTTARIPGFRRPAAPHYDVVALRVEFQPDTTRFTTGDGTFSGTLFEDGLTPSIDPLPHDAAYFEAHLAFLEDYVARVSDGKTRLTTHLVPEVVRVSQRMGAYSPTGLDADSDAERAKLAALVAEAWTLASAQTSFDLSGFDPATTAFVLFHAGVGRDIELIGTTLDKTPEDLPSIFFSNEALEDLLGGAQVDFHGFPIDHTILLPRTETRRAYDFIQDEPFLAEFTINGLAAASFFNYLGVPDLFDTSTGESAIGPFGLMDPLGLFAYNGLFPPEPTAWTKEYLGWAEVEELTGTGPVTASLLAASLPASSQAARARVSGAEYFLVENRHRDPEGDGLVLRVWKDGAVVEQRVENGQEDFNAFNVEGFVGGVVVGVDNYDWALPGGLDEEDTPLVGGILIWHVDERRIAAGFEANTINADPERRGLDLEEADGAQDIGFPQDNPFGPQSDLGSPFDFFYEGNPVVVVYQTGREIRLYENRFGPDTFPSSETNEGGPSFIVLEDFSPPGVEMTFTYHLTSEAGITPIAALDGLQIEGPIGEGGSVAFDVAGPDDRIFVHAGRALQAIDLATGEASMQPGQGFSVFSKPVFHPPSDYLVAYVDPRRAGPQDVLVVGPLAEDGPGTPYAEVALPVAADQLEAFSPLISVSEGDGYAYYLGLNASDGTQYLVRVSPEGEAEISALPGDDRYGSLVFASSPLLAAGREGLRFLPSQQTAVTYDVPASAEVGQVVSGVVSGGGYAVPVTSEGVLFFWRGGPVAERIDVAAYVDELEARRRLPAEPGARLSGYPVMADLDGDDRLDVVTTYGRWLLAFTQGGALVEGFPVRLAAPSVAQPLVAEMTDSGGWSVVVAATDGYLYAYDFGTDGASVPGFPLAVGGRIEATPLLVRQRGSFEPHLFAVAVDGTVKGWVLEDVGEVWWGELYGGNRNRSTAASPGVPTPEPGEEAGLIVEAETYNWPNPVRDGQTYIRCETTRDARLDVVVIDAAGTRIGGFTVENVRAGVPVEHRWRTDAESGVYFARVTATADDGATATHLIKIAVLR